MITFVGLQLLVGEWNIFQQAVEGSIFFGDCIENFSSEQPRTTITVLLSPMYLRLARCVITRLFTLFLKYKSWNNDIGKYRDLKARLAVLVHSKKEKIQIRTKSLVIALEQEDSEPSDPEEATAYLRGVAMEEALEELLSFLICFPYPFLCNATRESLAITRGRLRAMGFSEDQARKCESFILDRFRHRFSIFEATTRCSKDSSRNFHFSHHVHQQTHDMFGEDKVVDSLIKSTVADAIEYISGFELRNRLEWFNILILDLPSGFTLDIDVLAYDWRLCGKTNELLLRNGAGRKLVALSCGCHELGPQFSEGLLLNFNRQISDVQLGTNGVGFIDLSDDDYVHHHVLTREPHLEYLTTISASVGVFDIHFSDFHYSTLFDQWTSLIHDLIEKTDNQMHTAGTSVERCASAISTSIDIGEMTLLLCTDDFYPFTKIVLTDASADLSRTSILRSEMKRMQVVARCNNIYMYDLSPEGQLYNNIIDSTPESSLEFRMSVSNDTIHHPSEILVVISGVSVFFVRRYINELVSLIFACIHVMLHTFSTTNEKTPDSIRLFASIRLWTLHFGEFY